MPDNLITPYQQSQPYQVPVPEDHQWKREYTRIDFENSSFAFIKKKLKKMDIPIEKIDDLIDELMIIVNNAGKMNIKASEITWLLDEFDTFWDNFCIYSLKNSRWIDELNHVRKYAMYILIQEYHKSIDGWMGDNILRHRIEQTTSYNVRQENVEQKKRGWFRNKKPTQPSPAVQGFQTQTQG